MQPIKGFLSFLILWLVNKKTRTGVEIALEIEKRKGVKPTPGTIYPALKYLKDKKLIKVDKQKRYSLTPSGRKEMEGLIKHFFSTFCDLDDMRACCSDKKDSK